MLTSPTAKRLIRKCKCGNIMIVDVDTPLAVVQVSYSNGNRNYSAYRKLECVDETCYLRKWMTVKVYYRRNGYRTWRWGSHLKDLKWTNRSAFRAVFCGKCGAVNHLSLFTEPKL